MKTVPTILVLALAAWTAHAASLQSKHLAVLRAGDGQLDLKLRQSPVFIDEFAPGSFNQAPISSIAIPTNGPNTLFFNGHAATEGILARSLDHHLLTIAGYGGVNLLQSNGTPSVLNIGRGLCTVDSAGTIHTRVYQNLGQNEKMNPRGVVTDGTNNFWGCGNAYGTVYWNPTSGRPVVFNSAPNSRAIRIVGGTLYVTLNQADATAGDTSAGIFSFIDGTAVGLPHSASSALKLEVKAKEPYTKIAGFDMNPEHTIAYTADTVAGIQKYVKTNGTWQFAYNFSIPQADNNSAGCFGIVVDFSGATPIIYATTTEGYNGSVNSNRVVQIVDTGATAKVTTIAQAGSTKMAYRGIDFTPEP
jgi:hypothetical protein